MCTATSSRGKVSRFIYLVGFVMFIDVSKPLIPQSLELGQSRDATNATLGNVEKYLTGQLIFFGAAESTDTSPQVCWRSDITAQLCNLTVCHLSFVSRWHWSHLKW